MLSPLMLITVSGQPSFAPGTFIAPIDLPLYLSGTFGEPRSDHFHSGIDIRTNERTGFPVKAISEGTLTRIRVAPNGYGKAIYIRHPNGYTSVYAHLDHFNPSLEKLIRAEQYKMHSYTVDVSVAERAISFRKGDIIAYSGNTGSSGGPHLHFEIRESSSENPVNPLIFGYTIEDDTRPLLKGLYWYNISDYYHTGPSPLPSRLINDSTWVSDTLFIAENIPVGLGWKGFDQQNDVPNKNGLYSLSVTVNDTPVYAWQIKAFSFDETRYANCMIDYKNKWQGNGDIYQCFRLPGNQVSLLFSSPGSGVIRVKAGDTLHVKIMAADYNGNTTYTRSTIIGKEEIPANTYPRNVWPLRSFQYTTPSNKVLIPGGTFYDSLLLVTNTISTDDKTIYSDILQLHDDEIPLHNKAEIFILPQQRLPAKYAAKTIIVHRNSNEEESALPTVKTSTGYTANTRKTGKFYLKTDTIPPEICLSNFDYENRKFFNGRLQAYITDELSGIKKYAAWLDGSWFPMEYDAKNNLLFWKMEDVPKGKKHSLKIVVTDYTENTKILSINFIN